MKTLICIIVLALAGCGATIPANPEKMSAEQLTAFAKDKNANVACGVINGPWGKGVATYVVLDKAVVFNGSVTVDSECKVTITNDSRVPN